MIYASLDLENSLWTKGFKLVCGVDEVGRGCFAGPVVAGAVIFQPEKIIPKGIADSKLLKPKDRLRLAAEIKEQALSWAVGEIGVEVINQIGIGNATQLAFLEAVNNLQVIPDQLLIDAFFIQGLDKGNQKPIKDGDKLSISIAAASIIAKVYRDQLMEKLDGNYPFYGFSNNKGYGTKFHREAVKRYGLSEVHRTSFNLGKFL